MTHEEREAREQAKAGDALYKQKMREAEEAAKRCEGWRAQDIRTQRK